jgi:hypothetical protein
MFRRDFGKLTMAALASAFLAQSRKSTAAADAPAPGSAAPPAAAAPGVTAYAADFVVNTQYEAIPAEVLELGKKSILDGFGLALAGTKAETGPLCLKYLDTMGSLQGSSSIIGTSRKSSPQLAALVNGVSIHADDFDDTQLAVAKDRVYGLLTHPTVPVLPAIFALAERRKCSGKELMLAYTWGSRLNARWPRRSRLAITKTGSIPRARAVPSARRLPARNYWASMPPERDLPSASPAAARAASEKTSAP